MVASNWFVYLLGQLVSGTARILTWLKRQGVLKVKGEKQRLLHAQRESIFLSMFVYAKLFQYCLMLCDALYCSLARLFCPCDSQARILGVGCMPSSRESS